METSPDKEAFAWSMVTEWKIYYAQRIVWLDVLDKNGLKERIGVSEQGMSKPIYWRRCRHWNDSKIYDMVLIKEYYSRGTGGESLSETWWTWKSEDMAVTKDQSREKIIVFKN